MQQTVARLKLQDEVILRLAESQVVTLLGAHQVGKTTLARQVQERVGTATAKAS
jgi:nicotinamide riboside kinase